MRTLNFIVDKQLIRPDPNCDFSGIVSGTKGYLRAEFSFSKEWEDCRKVAVFKKTINEECYAPLIGNACMVPDDVLSQKKFRVSVIGEKDQYRITTNRTEVKQNG